MKRARPVGAGVTKRPKKRTRISTSNRLPANLRAGSSEIKGLDVPFGTVSLNTTASITCLNLVRAGTSFMNRVGRRIELKNLTLSCSIDPIRTIATQDYVRVLVVYDRQTNGANPAIADILQSTDQAGANTTTSWSGINLNNRDRFRIFVDERITLPSQTFTAGVITNPGWVDPVKTTFNIKRFVKLGREVTQYKADSAPAVVADIATGGLFLVTIGQFASGGEGYQMEVETRLRYNDM